MRQKRFHQKKVNIVPFAIGTVMVVVIGIFCMYEWAQAQAFSKPDGTSSTTSTSESTASVVSTEKTVCLDPGHGTDADPGDVNGDVVERDINLIVANKTKALLEIAGYKVVMTRTSNDQTLDNTARADYCNSQSADIMLSIHHNGFDDNTTDYATALYYKPEDQALAQAILDATSSKLGVPNDGLSTLEDNALVKSNMPAALSEAFFVSSDDEKAQIDQDGSTRLDDEAAALVTGIENYFANK